MTFKNLLTIALLLTTIVAVDSQARACKYKNACQTDKNCDCYSARSCRYIKKQLYKERTTKPVFVPEDEDEHGFGCYCSQQDYDNAGQCVKKNTK